MNSHTTRLTVRGTVQGVGYRFAAAARARELGVTGHIRNADDGSVVAEVTGPTDAVAAFVAWAHRGPAAASVASVDVREVPDDERADTGPLPSRREDVGGDGSGLAIIG
ncbi:acylphosphatase [Galbitalea sp. SE-J8]|uniref:acylphosphatase n=1 Tax=Galbitalea sp. SE-J8 TaxID=3054952 RepID=UPI00259CBDF1|nr:acylphosphatase [Galbitalea sp. SE-J8]MDM4763164.1 acylphosphatase [Galbitalea sp. SE-J8]